MAAELNVGALMTKKADRTAGLAGLVPPKRPTPFVDSSSEPNADKPPQPKKKAHRPRSTTATAAPTPAETHNLHSDVVPNGEPSSYELNGTPQEPATTPKKIAVTVYVGLDVKEWISQTSKARTSNQTSVVLDCIELAYDHLLRQAAQDTGDTGRRRLFSVDDTQPIRRHDSRTRVQLFLRLTPENITVLDQAAIDAGLRGNRSALIETAVLHCMKEEAQ